MSLDRDELDGLLGAFAADALDETTHRLVAQSLPDHPDLLADLDRLRSAMAPLGRLTVTPPATGGVDRLMARALAARAAGRPVGDRADASIRETYGSARDNLLAVLSDLRGSDGSRTTIYGVDVTGLVAHLAAIEHVIGDRLGLWPPGVDVSSGHVGVGGSAHGTTLRDAAALFQRRSASVLDRIGVLGDDDLAERVGVHGIEFDVGEMLTIRAFEIWSHTEDVCRAVGREVPAVDGPVIRTMCIQAIDLLTFFMSRSSEHHGKTVRITLTGPGGGSWPRRLDRDAADPDPSITADATVVADGLDFCRLFADRVDPDAAVTQWLGDASLVGDLVALAPTFADYGERIESS